MADVRRTIAQLRRAETLDPCDDPVIGCRILTTPFFWPEEMWLPAPANFSGNTIAGRGYSTDDPDALTPWNAVQDRLGTMPQAPQPVSGNRYGSPMLMQRRLGQGTIRLAVTDGSARRCAVSGEKTLPILDAAHIQSYSDGGTQEVSNGLPSRTDIHRLSDLGYVTVTEQGRFAVTERLKRDFDNGVRYHAMQGQEIAVPHSNFAPPSPEVLRWNRENRYIG